MDTKRKTLLYSGLGITLILLIAIKVLSAKPSEEIVLAELQESGVIKQINDYRVLHPTTILKPNMYVFAKIGDGGLDDRNMQEWYHLSIYHDDNFVQTELQRIRRVLELFNTPVTSLLQENVLKRSVKEKGLGLYWIQLGKERFLIVEDE